MKQSPVRHMIKSKLANKDTKLYFKSKPDLLGKKECTFGPSYWCASKENAKKCQVKIISFWENICDLKSGNSVDGISYNVMKICGIHLPLFICKLCDNSYCFIREKKRIFGLHVLHMSKCVVNFYQYMYLANTPFFFQAEEHCRTKVWNRN